MRILIQYVGIWQHAPRVNGEIPDVNDATLDHETLSERCQTLAWCTVIVCFRTTWTNCFIHIFVFVLY